METIACIQLKRAPTVLLLGPGLRYATKDRSAYAGNEALGQCSIQTLPREHTNLIHNGFGDTFGARFPASLGLGFAEGSGRSLVRSQTTHDSASRLWDGCKVRHEL